MDKSIKGEQVCEELKKIKAARGLPQRIKVDNGPAFISRTLDAWAYFNKVNLDYSRSGTTTDNPHIESINERFQDECLSIYKFISLEEPEAKLSVRLRESYGFRPHSITCSHKSEKVKIPIEEKLDEMTQRDNSKEQFAFAQKRADFNARLSAISSLPLGHELNSRCPILGSTALNLHPPPSNRAIVSLCEGFASKIFTR